MAKNATQPSSGMNEIFDKKKQIARRYARESMVAGAKAAAIASVATAIPIFASMKMMPWTRRSYLNPVSQALLFWTVAGGAFFIAADKTARQARFSDAVITNGIQA